MSTIYNPPLGEDELDNEFDDEFDVDYYDPLFSDEDIDEAFRVAADGTDEVMVEFAHDNRLNLLVNTYQLADSILARGGISCVRVSERGRREAAWTDGKTVYVNDQVIDATDFDNIENLNGANFHELSHILFSPRSGTAFIKGLEARGEAQSYVILEDQRIETLMSVMYPSTTVWLSSQVLRWVLDTPSVAEYGYIYVRGRRYLDGKLRGLLRSTFIRPDLLPEIDRIIDAYRKLVFPRDFAIAEKLVEDWHKIMMELMPPQSSAANHQSGYKSPSKGHAVTQATQKALQSQEGSSEDEVDPSDGDGSDEDAGEACGESQPGDGAPSSGKEGGLGDASVKTIAKGSLDVLRNQKAFKKEIQQKQRQVGVSEGDPSDKSINGTLKPVSEKGLANRNKLVRLLTKLVMAADPGWLTRESSGKLNVGRFMAEQDYESAFDMWEEGVHDATDMEVVILTDDSGSMYGVINDALEASWTVKSALDDLGIPVTSSLFANTLRTLYTRTEKANRTQMKYYFQNGGTEVCEGLEMATRIFTNSKRKQKILIVFTDGAWYGSRDKYGLLHDDYIAKMKKMGVVTSVAFISNYGRYKAEDVAEYRQHYGHGADVFGIVNSNTMLEFMKKLITTSISNTIRKGRG
jgi:hypothetical protein